MFETRSGSPVTALEEIDLEVGAEEFVTVVGRSGCGKSTLLRLIAGLVPLSRGRITIGARAVDGPRNDVGLMFQQPALMPWRTVLQNVLFPVEILGLDRRAARSKAEELLSLVGLEGFENRRPWELSGGMQQRVALCRALIHEPRVLLMDEPFAALDALTREELSLELQRIWSDRRATIVFVTHSIPEAAILSDRIVVLTPRPGRVARVVDVTVPRPRAFGDEFHAEALARAEEDVRTVLSERRESVERVA
ncbi:MAG: ABC transporter ATP-binding protein [Gaiellaceae bacterium]